MNKSQKTAAKAMQRNHFRKYHKKISLEEALEKVNELLIWLRTEGRELERKYPFESDRIINRIKEHNKYNKKYRN